MRSKLCLPLIALVLSACSHVVHVQTPISKPPLVEKHPSPIGVIFSENIQNHKCLVSKGYISDSWEIRLGPASIEMFDFILSALFEKVVVFESVESALDKGMNKIMEIRLIEFNGCDVGWPIFGANIRVTYEASLYDSDAAVIATWQGSGFAISGESTGNCTVGLSVFEPEGNYLSIMTCIAMRKAAAGFIVNLQKNKKIQAFLKK